MGFCTYCYRSVGRDSYGYSNECFGYDQARRCGISGPNDPARLANKREYEANKAKELRREAVKIMQEARANAASLRRQADDYARSAKEDANG